MKVSKCEEKVWLVKIRRDGGSDEVKYLTDEKIRLLEKRENVFVDRVKEV